jgi:predicted CoA-binding protein
MNELIQKFFTSETYAVAGASTKPEKYGNMVFQKLLDSGRTVYPLNPAANQVAGRKAYPSIEELPDIPDAVSIVTPPPVTRKVVASAIEAGIKHIWMQPGAEDAQASESAREAGLNVIDDGSCILVALALNQSG